MISQKLENKLRIVWLLLVHGLLFFLIPTFFIAFTESNHSIWDNNDPYVKYGLQALFGIFSGVSASLFFIVFLKFFNNDDNCLKLKIESIHEYMEHLNKTFTDKTGCAALGDNPFSDDIRRTNELIKTKEVETILTSKYIERLSDERKIYKNSNHILTLSFDLLRGYYSGEGLKRLFEERKLLKEHAIRRIVIVEDDLIASEELTKFIRNFEGCDWRVIRREELIINGKHNMFRDFAIFCNQDKKPEKAYFTFVTKSMGNLFTKTSWAPYYTSNKKYIKNLHDRFEELWDAAYVKNSTIETWLKNT